jgi:hypothetical protein
MPEVGSRFGSWIVVNDQGTVVGINPFRIAVHSGCFRYIIRTDLGISVRIVIGDYLIAEVLWE